jgi:arylsulfatase A-like enzyme
MFSSDNGASFSAGVDTKFFNSVSGLRGLKMELYEGGIRVPFIARWPNHIKANTVSNHVSVQYDIMPTLAELSGSKVTRIDGQSLLPELLGQQTIQKNHEFLYFEYPENGGQLAIRIGNWKGVKMNVRKNPKGKWELYDLLADQYERNNVAEKHPEIIEKMNAILKREHTHPHILDWEFIDPKIIRN